MSENTGTNTNSTPKHLWVVGIIALLWSAMGAFDYLMTQTQNEGYMSQFSEEQLAFFYGFPAWLEAFWAMGVWGGLAGSILLLMKRNWAVWAFLASFIGALVTTIQNYGISNGLEVMGDPMSVVFTIIILVVALGLFLYSRAMAKQGVIR